MFVWRSRPKGYGVITALSAFLAVSGCQTTKEMAPTTRALDGGITHITQTVPVAGGANVLVDLYLPAGAATKPVPGVFVIPTYYAQLQGRSEAPDRAYAIALARQGYATLVPVLNQYGPRAYHPGHEPDIASVAKWFRDRPEVMDDRLASVGFSMGGYYGSILAIADPTMRAVVGYYGSYDPTLFAVWSVDKATGPGPRAAQISAAVLLLHGEADNETKHSDAVIYRDRLAAAGRMVELVSYRGAFHRYDRGPSDLMGGAEVSRAGYVYRIDPAARDDSWQRTLAWLDKFLR